MTWIEIREKAARAEGGFDATLRFDGAAEFPLIVRAPFSGEEEALLEWYYEKRLELPFVGKANAATAAASVPRYGEALFGQVFADPRAYARYRAAIERDGVGSLRLTLAGSPEFHHLHWEALKDPDLPHPLALEAPMVRQNLVPQPLEATVAPSPTINLLVVTARPFGRGDVSYRTISRPLVAALRTAGVPVRIDLLRPGTYEALAKHLEAKREEARQRGGGPGFYHVVHFDAHGGLATYEALQKGFEADRFLFGGRYGRNDLLEYEGKKAFVFLEEEGGSKADPVEAGELAKLLLTHQVPVVILNACQSAKQEGTEDTSLGSRLIQAGMQTVLAMAYSVTVTAAEILMAELYSQLFARADLPAAIRSGRRELYNRKGRRARYNQTIDLEDWLLPVVYQNGEVPISLRDFTVEESAAWYGTQAERFPEPKPTYGFWGRDLDVLEVERRLLQHNLLLVRGMGGAGKTTLLQHLAAWWQETGFIDRVFRFEYDRQPWTRQQILIEIARPLLGEARFYSEFQPLGLAAQQAYLAAKLRGARHLLILDNLESITGATLALRNTLQPEEREALHRFLADLSGGRTLVLLGSRSGEAWLSSGTFEQNVYDLPGLDPEAASAMAEEIVKRFKAEHYRGDEAFERLVERLQGYPLALQVILPNLAKKSPAEVLAALEAGDVGLDAGTAEKKTESLLACIGYSFDELTAETQRLLLTLAPFTGVVNTTPFPHYVEKLGQQPALAGEALDRWQAALADAQGWGLLGPHAMPDFLTLQPILPYFLRARLQAPESGERKKAIETAFREYFAIVGKAIYDLLESEDPHKQQIGLRLTGWEYENLCTALNLALEAEAAILNPYSVLSSYFYRTQEAARGLALGESVLARLEAYSPERRGGSYGLGFVGVVDDVANRQSLLKRHSEAERTYQRALSLLPGLTELPEHQRRGLRAGFLHQLGLVAQEQRQWSEAEQCYQEALRTCAEFNDRFSQANTYHQLGRVAHEQQQWSKAKQYYQEALRIDAGFNDRYSQAQTYHSLGVVAQEQRQWSEAKQYYQEALRINDEFNDRHSQAQTHHNLGVVAQVQRQWSVAELYYQEALRIYVEFNDRYSQARTYSQLAHLAQDQGNWPQARSYFLQALEIFRAFGDQHYIAMTLSNLARLWYASADETLLPATAELLKLSTEEIEELFRGALELESPPP